jgi:K+-transporting ATPase ATPase C chain
VVGSELIGQNFTSRPISGAALRRAPSPTTAASGGSNLGPTNPALKQAAEDRARPCRKPTPTTRAIPIDLLTASASGLDPQISPAAAEYQAGRVARARGITLEQVRALVRVNSEAPQWGLFGNRASMCSS